MDYQPEVYDIICIGNNLNVYYYLSERFNSILSISTMDIDKVKHIDKFYKDLSYDIYKRIYKNIHSKTDNKLKDIILEDYIEFTYPSEYIEKYHEITPDNLLYSNGVMNSILVKNKYNINRNTLFVDTIVDIYYIQSLQLYRVYYKKKGKDRFLFSRRIIVNEYQNNMDTYSIWSNIKSYIEDSIENQDNNIFPYYFLKYIPTIMYKNGLTISMDENINYAFL